MQTCTHKKLEETETDIKDRKRQTDRRQTDTKLYYIHQRDGSDLSSYNNFGVTKSS